MSSLLLMSDVAADKNTARPGLHFQSSPLLRKIVSKEVRPFHRRMFSIQPDTDSASISRSSFFGANYARIADLSSERKKNVPGFDKGLISHLSVSDLTPWVDLERRLSDWARLERGWDSEDAAPPSKRAIYIAREFLNLAALRGLPPPRAYIASDGEIGFHWKEDKKTATWSLLPQGEFLGFATRAADGPLRLQGNYDTALDGNFMSVVRAFK